MKKIKEKTFEFLNNFLNEVKIFYTLFKKENVFKFLLIIVILNIISGLIYLIIEYQDVISSITYTRNPTIIDKIISVLYWGIVTISTCGYGDISPDGPIGRIFVTIFLYLSIASVTLFTANITSALTTKKMMERRGIMNIGKLKDHYIICGWKKSINYILSEIINLNPGLPLKKIVIIANIEPDVIELFNQQYPEFQDISILRGNQYNETLLKKANVQYAKKVIILADESENSSFTEIDSKTVLTAMTINSIAKNVRIVAEILDIQFEKYLKQAHVDEIIYTNEYNKMLIANSIENTGMAKIIYDILNPKTEAFITTEEIPQDYIGKKFAELKEYFSKEKKSIVIGVLENVGSYVERKQEALREAQKTANINELIENLKNAKKMENNLPNINPGDNYIINKNSLAILVGRRTYNES